MQKVNRRQCQSQKECNECGLEIPIGAYYYNNPNVSWCEGCKRKLESEAVEEAAKDAKREIIAKLPNVKVPLSENDSYIVKDPCQYCNGNAMDSLIRGIPCCLNKECQDKAIMETI